MLFELQRRERHGWTVVAVFGELDLSVVPRVRAALRAVVPPGSGSGGEIGPVRVLIDLGDVDFLDSAGLGVVLGAVRRIRGAGGVAVIVVAPSSPPAQLVDALELAAVVPVAWSIEDAVAGRMAGSARVEPAVLAAAAQTARSPETVLVDDGSAGDG